MKCKFIFCFLWCCLLVASAQQKNIYLCAMGDQYNFDFNANPDSTGYYINYVNTGSNVWQAGKSNKPYFTTSNRKLMTDTVNPYPVNNLSIFEFSIIECYPPPVGGFGIRMVGEFTCDSDSLIDGGTIEFSHDRVNWTNVLTGSYYWGSQFASLQSLGGKPGYSGRYAGGQFEYDFWHFQDTLTVRFTFASDNVVDNRSGWMLDWLFLEQTYPAGIDNRPYQNQNKIFPNPAHDHLNLSLEGTAKIQVIDLRGNVVLSDDKFSDNAFDISSLQQGMYFLKTISDKGVRTYKFCKE